MSEFKQRKKDEKRRQAERQVMKAFKDGLKPNICIHPEIENLYSTIDVSKILEIKRERLRDWLSRGFVSADLPSTSKGTITIFTWYGVLKIYLFKRLVDLGITRKAAKRCVDQVALERFEQIDCIDYGITMRLDDDFNFIEIYLHKRMPQKPERKEVI